MKKSKRHLKKRVKRFVAAFEKFHAALKKFAENQPKPIKFESGGVIHKQTIMSEQDEKALLQGKWVINPRKSNAKEIDVPKF